jgi:predicted nucleic acid-binding Zn ribbon protein
MIPNGPEPLGEILSRLFALRGWGRTQDRLRLESAWRDALGESCIEQTRVGMLRRGVLEILVNNAVLLQELAHYRKRALLARLHALLPNVPLHDLRFRSGSWNASPPREP